MQPTKNNQFKIIAGKHRGQKFNFPNVGGLRPTPSKIRETLFNWIQSEAANKSYLDLFAGSGALSFEAVSRGAKCVVSVEKSLKAYLALKKNQQKLNCKNIQALHQDAFGFLSPKNQQNFDFILLDPPFYQNILPKTLKLLADYDFVATGGKIYIESEYKILLTELSTFFSGKIDIIKQKQSGQVHYCLIKIL